MPTDLSPKAVLRRQRDRVASGVPLVLDDSEDVGNKHTHASWGMCSREAHAEFSGRRMEDADHPYKLAAIPCPMRYRNREKGHWGCFYECSLFRRGLKDREKVLALYDELIREE